MVLGPARYLDGRPRAAQSRRLSPACQRLLGRQMGGGHARGDLHGIRRPAMGGHVRVPDQRKGDPGRTLGASEPEPSARPVDADRPGELHAALDEHCEDLGLDSEGEDGGRRLVRVTRRSLHSERRGTVQQVPRPRSRSEIAMNIERRLAALLIVLLPAVAAAHHGSSFSYDTSKLWTTWATVTEFNYKNPHPTMTFDRTTKDGKV